MRKFYIQFLLLIFVELIINKVKSEENKKKFIVIPFKSYFPKYDYSPNIDKALINSYVRKKIYLDIKNESGQKLEIILNKEESRMHTREVVAVLGTDEVYYKEYNTIDEDICTFNFQNSNSYKFLSDFNEQFRSIKNVCYAKEKIFLYKDLNLKEKQLYDLEFYHSSNETHVCFFAGLQISESLADKDINLFCQLQKLINSNYKTWTLKFTSPNEGVFIFGDIIGNKDLKFYNDNIDANYLPLKTYAYSITSIYWKLEFDKVIFGDYVINQNKILYFYMDFQSRYITVPKEFFYNIKLKYLLVDEEKTDPKFICFDEDIEFFFHAIYCKKKEYLKLTDNYKKLPNLDLFSNKFGVNITFTPHDLFVEKDNKLYFYIAYNSHKDEDWGIGTIFMEKYLTVFNNNETMLKILKKSDKDKDIMNKENNYGTIIFIVILGIILSGLIFGFLGVLFGKKIYLQRKKKANELNDDEYDYSPQSINEGNNKDIVKENNDNNIF